MKKSLIALVLGTLALGMSEFMMMGILGYRPKSWRVNPRSQTPHLGLCAGRMLRRAAHGAGRPTTTTLKQIVLELTGMIIIGNITAALSPSCWMLMCMRFEAELIGTYEFCTEHERELVYVHRAVWDGEVCPSGEILTTLGKCVFTPNLEGEMKIVLK